MTSAHPRRPVLPDHAPRLDAITGLRWWAAFAVFGFHVMVFAPLPATVRRFLEFGDYGVAFFFVLSGFVLTWSMKSGMPISTFYWRRIARIYPLHFVTLLLAIPVFYSFVPQPEQWWVKPVNVAILALSFVVLQGWWRDPVVLFSGNPAAWTLTIEFFFYALHPFFSRVLTRFSRTGALWAAAIVCGIAVAQRGLIQLDPAGWFAALPWPVLRLNEFALGMCLAWAFRKGWRPRVHPAVPALGIALYIVAGVLIERTAPTSAAYTVFVFYTTAVMTILFGLLIVATSATELAGGARWMRWRPLVALGEWSFAFYLIHATLIYTAMNIWGPQPPGWQNLVLIAALAVIATAVAAALHLWVERPAESRLRDWERRMRARRVERLVSRTQPVPGGSAL